ncbi:MAG: hypothetical protein ACK5GZ_15920 [Cyanobium sp.]|jgi:hypothetical protein
MPRETRYAHPIGLRVDQETLNWCRRAGGGKGETPGARLLLALGIERFSTELEQRPASIPDQLEAIAAQLRELQSHSVSGSGAALLTDPTPDRINALRQEGAGLIVLRSGLLLPGLTPDGAEALLALDLEAGQLGITAADGSHAVVELGEVLPALGSLAALVAGVLTRCWETVAGGDEPADAPPGRRMDWGLVIHAAHPADGLSRVELPGAVLCLHSLQLLQLSAELFGLLARRSAASLQDRAELEQLLARPSALEPPVSLCWSRSHGEA